MMSPLSMALLFVMLSSIGVALKLRKVPSSNDVLSKQTVIHLGMVPVPSDGMCPRSVGMTLTRLLLYRVHFACCPLDSISPKRSAPYISLAQLSARVLPFLRERGLGLQSLLVEDRRYYRRLAVSRACGMGMSSSVGHHDDWEGFLGVRAELFVDQEVHASICEMPSAYANTVNVKDNMESRIELPVGDMKPITAGLHDSLTAKRLFNCANTPVDKGPIGLGLASSRQCYALGGKRS